MEHNLRQTYGNLHDIWLVTWPLDPTILLLKCFGRLARIAGVVFPLHLIVFKGVKIPWLNNFWSSSKILWVPVDCVSPAIYLCERCFLIYQNPSLKLQEFGTNRTLHLQFPGSPRRVVRQSRRLTQTKARNFRKVFNCALVQLKL